jgi:ketosteroid isomerase-like protein
LVEASDHVGNHDRLVKVRTYRQFLDRCVSAYNARDWDAFRALFAPDVRGIDRRGYGWGTVEGVDAFVNVVGIALALAPDLHMHADLLAAGSGGGVARFLTRGHLEAGGGETEGEMFVVSRTEGGVVDHFEYFDEASFGEALARFEEFVARTDPERVFARQSRLVTASDWDSLADCFTEDYESVDSRPFGWEPMHGREAVVDFFRSWEAVLPDGGELRFETIAGDDDYVAGRCTAHGHLPESGGPVELEMLIVATVRDGRIANEELFDASDEATAIARLRTLMNA